MASLRVLSTLLLLGKLQLLVIAGSGPDLERKLCPDEVLSLKCDHEELGNGNKIEVEWKVKDSRRNSLWTQVAYCNDSLKCRVTKSKPSDAIKVLGISKGTITIQRVSRNTSIRHLDFLCVIQTQEKAYKHKTKINLAVECIWTQIGADVNLTRHLADVVPRTRVQDVWLYDVTGKNAMFGHCSSTMNCKLLNKGHTPPKFWNRLEQKDNSILLTKIKKEDEGLEMRVEIHFKTGLRRRSIRALINEAERVITLRIRHEPQQTPPQANDNATYTFPVNTTSISELLQDNYDAAPTVQTESGKVVGKIETLPFGKAVYTYLGISYAEPPVGELRFAAPRPVKTWSGIRNATDYGASCPQPDYPFPGVKIDGEENEDCLFLNVFVPSTVKPDDKMAVMVWIHGGAFTKGSSTEYPGHVLASFNDVIVVTLNYRLGILGFFNNAKDLKGNYGMYDQVLALKWVQDNIAAFGGDPNRVTIFGESAGAMSVSLHLVSPFSKGLFNRAIMQSGASSSPLLSGKEATPSTLKELTKIAKCQSEIELTRCLRNKSAEEIILLQEKLLPNSLHEITAPAVDRKFLADHPHKLYKHAKFAAQNVEVIVGFTSHEEALSVALGPRNVTRDGVSKKDFDTEVKHILERGVRSDSKVRHVEEMVKFHYSDHDDPNNKTTIRKLMTDFQDDLLLVAPAVFEASSLAKAGKLAYVYVFEHRPDFSPFPPWTGAVRGVDIGFVFGAPFKHISSLADFFAPRFSEIEMGFSMYFMKLWTNFAKYGNPTPPSSNPLIKWRSFTEDDQFYLALNVKPRLKQRYRAREVTFWNSLIPKFARKNRKERKPKKP